MKVTTADLNKIDAFIKDRIDEATYESIIPYEQKQNVQNAMLDHWKDLVKMEPDYLDALSDGPDIEGYLNGAGVDMDAVMDASESVEFETAILGWVEEVSGAFASFADMRVGYFRAIVSDIRSSWEALYREAFKEVLGDDPMSTGDPLDWEIQD